MYEHLNNAVIFASFVVQTLIIGLLIYRRVWRTLPIFFAYCVWDQLSNLTLVAIAHYAPDFAFHAYAIDAVPDAAITFAVLVELAWSLLRPLRASLPRSALVLVGILILVAAVIIWPFASLPSLTNVTTREGLLFVQLGQTIAILEILIFLVLGGGSQLLSISWRDRELQVATGLGAAALVNLTVAVLQTHQTSTDQYDKIALAGGVGYLACLTYWAFSFTQQEAERRQFTPQMQRFLLAVAGAARASRAGLEESQGKSSKPNRRG
jgi:hypothetical protein